MPTVAFPPMTYPLVAILRGLKPEETHDVVSVLIEHGFRAIEIPLNSPDPFTSIGIAAKLAPPDCLIGAGTVLSVEDVNRVYDVGGRLVVSPNVDVAVITHAAGKGMVTLPGVFTPTEALTALRAGATGLKFFPASVLGPSGISAIRAILPKDITIAAVGGVSEENFADYAKAGVTTFGLGSSLYKAGMPTRDVGQRAANTITAYKTAFGA